jgi:hypothetical protein
MTKVKSFSPQFANQMNRLNDEFIEFEIRWLRELLRFVDAHKPTRGALTSTECGEGK